MYNYIQLIFFCEHIFIISNTNKSLFLVSLTVLTSLYNSNKRVNEPRGYDRTFCDERTAASRRRAISEISRTIDTSSSSTSKDLLRTYDSS